jgi:hypothetical protein
MERLKSCSFCFLLKNFREKNDVAKKYFVFLFVSAIFLISGFFISTVCAEEEEEEWSNNVEMTEVNDDITEDTHWTKEGSPYVIKETIFIDEGVTLNIDPGVVVKFDFSWISNFYIDVYGKIFINGTDEEPVYFTSIYDDIGGSTDDDYEDCEYAEYDEEGNPIGEAISCESYDWMDPSIGDWGGINFMNSEGSELANMFLKYSEDAFYFDFSSANFENLNISDAEGGIIVGTESNVEIVGGTFNNLEDAFYLFDNGLLDVDNISVTNTEDGVTAFNGDSYIEDNPDPLLEPQFYDKSLVKITDSTIECTDDGMSIFNYYSLEMKGGSISCLNTGVYLFSEANAKIDGVKISGASENGIIAFDNTEAVSIEVINSEITGNGYGFEIFESLFVAHNNSIHDNTLKGVEAFDLYSDLDFTSNYWGDSSGPTHTTNPLGTGDEITDGVIFEPFLKRDPLIRQQNPVILIPGITGTYLIKDYGDKTEIWPDLGRIIWPFGDTYLNDLALEKDGKENIEMLMKVGDIIRGVESRGIHVFDKLISELINSGSYVEGEDLFVFPYDWRLSTTTNANFLKEKIDKILLDTGYENVDIVAHSMGGLVAKKYIADNGKDKVEQLVFVGTPQLGAPKSFKALMYGDDMGYEKNILNIIDYIILSSKRVKYISQNMPSVYELLPSKKYINENGKYVINALDKNTSPISLDYQQTKNFMIEKGRNNLMFPFAENLHDSIDDLDLSGIETHNFVGCGTKTIGEITVKQKRSWKNLFLGWVDDIHLKYINGDETVPLESANKTIGANIYYADGNTHGSLPSAEGVRQNILSILKGEELESYSNILDDASTCNVSGEVVSTHSPVELHIYDEEGNHTGPNADGDIEYGIDGVQYDVVEGENYVFLPSGVNYRIVTNATDTGGYNFEIESLNEEDDITNTYNWTLIPLQTLNSSGEIWIGPDYPASNYSVSMDQNGDGEGDSSYAMSYDGTAEAERATMIHSSSSGSYIKIFNQNINEINVAKIDKQEISNQSKQTIEKVVLSEKFYRDEVVIKEEGIKKDSLSASAADSGVEVPLLWPATALFGFVGILLAKMFIKL